MNKFHTLDAFAQFLIKHRLIDESAYYDPEGYDGGVTLARIAEAFRQMAE